jgi:hypothetical protein
MKFREMPLVCECGFAPILLKSVGFTTEFELVVHWKCSVCGKLVYVVKSLADCCRECPEEEAWEVMVPCAAAPFDDAAFLRSLGISTGEPDQ